jgi:hypothetical protein
VNKALAMQLAHDFGNLRDPLPQRHFDFTAGGINEGVVAAGCEMPNIRCGTDGV